MVNEATESDLQLFGFRNWLASWFEPDQPHPDLQRIGSRRTQPPPMEPQTGIERELGK
jgi:hypothetical protein